MGSNENLSKDPKWKVYERAAAELEASYLMSDKPTRIASAGGQQCEKIGIDPFPLR
jgi:hypothetical protein